MHQSVPFKCFFSFIYMHVHSSNPYCPSSHLMLTLAFLTAPDEEDIVSWKYSLKHCQFYITKEYILHMDDALCPWTNTLSTTEKVFLLLFVCFVHRCFKQSNRHTLIGKEEQLCGLGLEETAF